MKSRRKFITNLACISSSLALFSPAQALASPTDSLSLAFYHTHTGKRLNVTYFENGQYLPGALAAIDEHLMDFRTNETHPIDPLLLNYLSALQASVGKAGEFQVISGYRSPKTNAGLRSKSSGVAKRSLHMQGKAIDVRLTGVDSWQLRQAAMKLKLGGVGYYKKSNFIHIDTGRVRYW